MVDSLPMILSLLCLKLISKAVTALKQLGWKDLRWLLTPVVDLIGVPIDLRQREVPDPTGTWQTALVPEN